MFEYDEDAKMASEELDKYNFKYILGLCYDSDIRDPYDDARGRGSHRPVCKCRPRDLYQGPQQRAHQVR